MRIIGLFVGRWEVTLLLTLTLFASLTPTYTYGQTSNIPYQGTYYSSITSSILSDPRSLLVSLHTLLQQRTKLSYSALWQAFLTTDEDSYDICGGNTIHDPYSNTCWIPQQQKCGQYQHQGQCYNREHSWPKSWFGGMGALALGADTDLHHLYPTDGWINGQRGNWPYAQVAGGTVMGNGGKLGPSNTTGYTGNAFEPNDSYKGDLARTYFYMTTMYADQWTCCESAATLRSHIKPWHLTMLKQWHQLDPVSPSEMERNNDIYVLQGNRNPFVDHPEWVNLMNDFVANPPVGTDPTNAPTTGPSTATPTPTPTPASTTSPPTAGTVTPTPSGVVTTSPPTDSGDVTLITLFFRVSPPTTSTSTSIFRHDLIMELHSLLNIPIVIMIIISTMINDNIIQVQLAFQPDDIIYNSHTVQRYVTTFHEQYNRTNTTGTSVFTSTESHIFTQLITSSALQIQQSQRYPVQSCSDGTRVLMKDSCFTSSIPASSSSSSSSGLSSSTIAGIVITVIVIIACVVVVGFFLLRHRHFSFIRLSSPRRDSLQIQLNVQPTRDDDVNDEDQDQGTDYKKLTQQLQVDE